MAFNRQPVRLEYNWNGKCITSNIIKCGAPFIMHIKINKTRNHVAFCETWSGLIAMMSSLEMKTIKKTKNKTKKNKTHRNKTQANAGTFKTQLHYTFNKWGNRSSIEKKYVGNKRRIKNCESNWICTTNWNKCSTWMPMLPVRSENLLHFVIKSMTIIL